jgi:hypothetical protein
MKWSWRLQKSKDFLILIDAHAARNKYTGTLCGANA